MAFFSAVLVGVVFLVLNRMFFHLNAPDATIGALNSLYLNSNNIGLPIATYILGNPALVAPILVMQQPIFHTGGPDSAGRDHQGQGLHQGNRQAATASAAAYRLAAGHCGLCDFR